MIGDGSPMRWSDAERSDIFDQLGIYWPHRAALLRDLPLTRIEEFDDSVLPPVLCDVQLPDWALDAGVDGRLLVPACACPGREDWEKVDWILAAFWFLHGIAERRFESINGPIHSYSFRLKNWPPRMWSHAWVNRIAMFLRRWAAHREGQAEEAVFGAGPKPEIVLTHDVDAVRKMPAIRLKQSAFQWFNALRAAGSGSYARAVRRFLQGFRVLLSAEDYCFIKEIRRLEADAGLNSHFNFYGGARRRGFERLLDPGYDVQRRDISRLIRELISSGCRIGLHQSFNAWNDSWRMSEEKARLDGSAGQQATSCRQHWLRFSWEETWRAQERAGLTLDTTLGFNDRCGFRNACALEFRPQGCSALRALPMILMDSHLYDYSDYDAESRRSKIKHCVDEVRAVGGSATVIWHTHVLGRDYGWKSGFEALLATLSSNE